MLVFSPYNHITNIQQCNAVAIATFDLININLALFIIFFHYIIWEFFYLWDIPKMPDFINT